MASNPVILSLACHSASRCPFFHLLKGMHIDSCDVLNHSFKARRVRNVVTQTYLALSHKAIPSPYQQYSTKFKQKIIVWPLSLPKALSKNKLLNSHGFCFFFFALLSVSPFLISLRFFFHNNPITTSPNKPNPVSRSIPKAEPPCHHLPSKSPPPQKSPNYPCNHHHSPSLLS